MPKRTRGPSFFDFSLEPPKKTLKRTSDVFEPSPWGPLNVHVQVTDHVQDQDTVHDAMQVWVRGAKCRCEVQAQGATCECECKMRSAKYLRARGSSKLRCNGSVHALRASAVADISSPDAIYANGKSIRQTRRPGREGEEDQRLHGREEERGQHPRQS